VGSHVCMSAFLCVRVSACAWIFCVCARALCNDRFRGNRKDFATKLDEGTYTDTHRGAPLHLLELVLVVRIRHTRTHIRIRHTRTHKHKHTGTFTQMYRHPDIHRGTPLHLLELVLVVCIKSHTHTHRHIHTNVQTPRHTQRHPASPARVGAGGMF